MAMKDKIQSSILNSNQIQEYDLVCIYRNREAEEVFSGFLHPFAEERYWLYPVAEGRRILWLNGQMVNEVAAFLFSTKFLTEQSVQKDLLEKLTLHCFREDEIRIYFYKIV